MGGQKTNLEFAATVFFIFVSNYFLCVLQVNLFGAEQRQTALTLRDLHFSFMLPYSRFTQKDMDLTTGNWKIYVILLRGESI